LALLVAVVAVVVMARRTDAPWALSFRLYLFLAAFIVAIRIGFRILLAGDGPTVLVSLPRLRLPDFLTGASLFGPVSVEALAAGFADGLRLGTLIICVGAANSLANPKRLLSAVPGALAEFGGAIVVALSVFPRLAESAQRVNRARLLRSGRRRTRHVLKELVIPVLADSLEGSLALAAAMDGRGYGRRAEAASRWTGAGFAAAVTLISVGAFALLDLGGAPSQLGWPFLAAGVALAGWSLRRAGRRSRRSRYRPDRWRLAETVTAASGLVPAAAVGVFSLLDPAAAYPPASPLALPSVPVFVVCALLAAVVPAFATPPPPLTTDDGTETGQNNNGGEMSRKPPASTEPIPPESASAGAGLAAAAMAKPALPTAGAPRSAGTPPQPAVAAGPADKAGAAA
jgi:energy-coupling factor transport system permease protein